jgi:hypothetical protein
MSGARQGFPGNAGQEPAGVRMILLRQWRAAQIVRYEPLGKLCLIRHCEERSDEAISNELIP